jgi:HPt (histidine-containing phosphotransfer) domain-containing protein
MDGYISKPINPQMLFATLEHEAGQVTPIVQTDRAQPIGVSPIAGVDREALMARLGQDEALFAEVIHLFIEDCPERLVAIHAAVDARDALRIRAAAHSLKGSAGNISAAALSDAAGALERVGEETRLEDADAAWRRLSTEATMVMQSLRGFEASAAAKGLLCAR